VKTEDVKGVVTNIDDPAKAGRVKVALPSMDGQEFPDWIDPEFEPGWVAMPVVGDTVALVSPEGGDIVEFSNEMRYKGKVLNEANPVPDEFKENYPRRRGYMSPSGYMLIFEDDGGVILTTGKSGDNNIGITIDGETGQVKIYGTASVQIDTIGAVTIGGSSCTILGRPVVPGGGPI
jgi:hypothetical protein